MKKVIQLFFTVLFIGSLNAQVWKPKFSGSANSLLSVSIVDENLAYVSGSSGTILKTTDGGDIWTQQVSGTDKDLYEISFTSSTRGFAVGTGNNVLSTNDGGNTWTPLSIQGTDEGYYYRNIWFLNSDIGFITGGASGNVGVVLKTTNGGNSWNILTTNSSSAIYGIYFTSPAVGYYSNFNGEIKKTNNGGTTWSNLGSGINTTIYALYFTSEDVGYACGENGKILKTINAGASWDILNTNTSDVFTDMAFLDEYVGFAVGGNVANNTSTIFKTINGGQTWVTETTSFTRQYGCEFLSFDLGYSVGLQGSILKVTNITAADHELAKNFTNVKVFPNPTNRYITIESDDSNKINEQSIKIVNDLGMVIYSDKLNNQKSTIDLSKLSYSGIYYIHILDQNNNVIGIEKVILL